MFLRSMLFSVFLFFFLGTNAQTKPTIKASVNKSKILLGEPFDLVVEARIPGGGVVRPVRIDSLAHFEFLEKPVIDTLSNSNGITIKGVYKLTSFDSGHWVIPSFYLSDNIKSDTLPIDVVFSEFDPEQPYHDVKDIMEVKKEIIKKEWWIYIAGGALLLGLIIWLLTRKKKRVVQTPLRSATAYEEAMEQLEKLQRTAPASKEYYSTLIDILRLYVFKKKGILSLQKTTDDLVIQLQGLGMKKDMFDRLAQALRLSDFVKFAKYVPTATDDSAAFLSVKEGIGDIEQLNDAVRVDQKY